MPTDQGRRHPAHHFGGFLGLALHRAKSKSSEHLHPESRQHKKLDKRVLSSRDLASGFDNVLAEQPKFRKSEEEIRSPAALAESKRYTGDSVPFAIKYAVSKDTTTKLAMSVTAASASTQSQGDPDILDQALSNIRMKLKEMSSERTNMETRMEELEDGLETAYYQYRIQHPDSQPLPSFPVFTPFGVPVGNTEEVDGRGSPVTSVISLPAILPHFQQRGERFMTITKHTWQPPTPDMVSSNENIARADAGSPQTSPSISPYGATHHFLNTTPPSSLRAEPSSTSSAPRLLSHSTGLSESASTTPTVKGGLAHTRRLLPNPASPPRAHAANTSPGLSRSLNSSPSAHGLFSSHTWSQPTLRGRLHDKSGQLSHRNSLPDSLITTTIFEGATSGANDSKINTTRRKISSESQFPGFRKRSTSSGNFDHISKSPLLVKKTSVHDCTEKHDSKGKQDSAWFEDF